MDPHAAIELFEATAAAAAVTRLIHLNLAKHFPALLSYLCFLAVINLGFGLVDPRSTLYFWGYLVVEPLECIFSILAVRELVALAFHNYPGIRTLGRWVTYGGIIVALCLSLLLTGFFWNGAAGGRAHSHLFYFEVSQRSLVFSLAFVIITILVFLSKYPLHLSRNTLVSSGFFSVLFLSEASRLLIDSLAPKLYNHYVDFAGSVFVALCLLGWATMLEPETARVPAEIRFSSPQEEHLLQQLDSLNQLMTRAARR